MEKDRLVCQNKRAPTCTELRDNCASELRPRAWPRAGSTCLRSQAARGTLAGLLDVRQLVSSWPSPPALSNISEAWGVLDNYDMPELALDIARMVAGLARRPCARCLAASTLSGGQRPSGRLGLHGRARAGYDLT